MILDTIIENKKQELASLKKERSISQLEDFIKTVSGARSFTAALQVQDASRNKIIAEVKKASPSKGIIRQDFDPLAIAHEYEQNGAAAISVLTEKKFFQGDLLYLQSIRNAVSLPLLRKDFIFEPYQVYEARAFGADALLLIAAVLKKGKLIELLDLTHDLAMSALVEVHTRQELEMVLETDAQVIGINNRNLFTFTTDVNTTLELLEIIPENRLVVSESGINTRDDIIKLKNAGADAFLIGESLMREQFPGKKLKEFVYE